MKKGKWLVLFLLIGSGLMAQTETVPVEKKFQASPEAKSLLKLPEKNPLPDFLQKDFLQQTPNPQAAPKNFEKKIDMQLQEKFMESCSQDILVFLFCWIQ